jgi:hypothetical protein
MRYLERKYTLRLVYFSLRLLIELTWVYVHTVESGFRNTET